MNQVIGSLSNIESPSTKRESSYLAQKRIQNKVRMQEHQQISERLNQMKNDHKINKINFEKY